MAISGRDEAKLRKAAESIGGGSKLLIHACDVTDPAQVQKLVEHVTKQFGRIDILINNAGTNIKVQDARVDDRKLESVGAHESRRRVLLHQGRVTADVGAEGRRVINVNSISGKRAYPLAGAGYAAGKFGMHALAGCLAAEEVDSGIRVSTIYPGEIDTPILEARPTPVTAEQRAKILKPEDVAEAIYYVATLPPHVTVPELIIKPTSQTYF